jgi:adenylyltransferase/sulfurtransferase
MPVNNRYSRQIILKHIQKNGQETLKNSTIAIIGCGALGTNSANSLTRAGIGNLILIDRDIIELHNLQRQNLYTENDIELPKATTLKQKLQHINSDISIRAIDDDLNPTNSEKILLNVDLILDGTDNMLTRYLINDFSIKYRIPWIYAGVIQTYGMTMNIIPNSTPCLRCYTPNLPEPGTLPTCATAGVLNTIPAIIANIQTTEAIKILLNKKYSSELITYDVWTNDFQSYHFKRNTACPCCTHHTYDYLLPNTKKHVLSICDSGAYQITPTKPMTLTLKELAKKLQPVGILKTHPTVLKLIIPPYEINIFPNGRAIITGTKDKNIAKSLYTQYIGD